MPNWAFNKITFEGPEADIQTLIDRHIRIDHQGEMTLDFNTIVPMPASITQDEEILDWNLNNWGVKCEVLEFLEDEREKGFYAIIFSTAWNCPLHIFHVLASNYPNLHSYIIGYEEGMDWAYLGYNTSGDHKGVVIGLPPHWDRLMPLLEDMGFKAYTDLVERLRYASSVYRKIDDPSLAHLTLLLDAVRTKFLPAPFGATQSP